MTILLPRKVGDRRPGLCPPMPPWQRRAPAPREGRAALTSSLALPAGPAGLQGCQVPRYANVSFDHSCKVTDLHFKQNFQCFDPLAATKGGISGPEKGKKGTFFGKADTLWVMVLLGDGTLQG